jgi:transcriptional regulator with XRE-family HTH domain
MADKTGSSKGARALRASLKPKMNQADLAKALGVTQQAVSAWLSGAAQPKPELMARIEDLLGIPMRDWTEVAQESEPASTGTSG